MHTHVQDFHGVRKDLRNIHLVFLLLFFFVLPPGAIAQVRIAQLSDTHLGEPRAPHAAENLRLAVEMINARSPDAVVLSGDIGENPTQWAKAKAILKGLKAPLYYAPGNHDVHSNDVNRYRKAFGRDYYRFQVKGITFLVIDSQLLGNYDTFDAQTPPPLPPQTMEESEQMLAWLKAQASPQANIVIGIQHIPVFRDGNFPPDSKPYWIVSDPYRTREMNILHKIGVHHMLVGHWHHGRVFEHGGITWHVAPATSWLPWGGKLGFAMHTISPNGDVKTEFVPLGTQP